MKSFGFETRVHAKAGDYHDVIALHPSGPRFSVQKPVGERGPLPRHRAVNFGDGGPTLLVQGGEVDAPAVHTARLVPEMNDDHADKRVALHGMADAALTFGTGGSAFVGRVGFKTVVTPLLERAGVKSLMTAFELLGEAGRAAKGGKDLGLRDWVTIGFPIGWNKKSPLFQKTLDILVGADAKNKENLSEKATAFHKAKEIENAYGAIYAWMLRNNVSPDRHKRTQGEPPKTEYQKWRRRNLHDDEANAVRTMQENFNKAINTLDKAGHSTGLQADLFSANRMRTNDEQWGRAIAAVGNRPASKEAAAALEGEVADLSNLDAGLKLILHWLRN